MAKANPKPNEDFWMFKAPPILKTRIDETANKLVRLGKFQKTPTYKRMGIAIARYDNLWNELLKADFIEDKRRNK